MDQALAKAKELLGGSVGMANAIGGLTPQAVSQWKRVPANRAIVVEKLTGIPREELRPDVFTDKMSPDRAGV